MSDEPEKMFTIDFRPTEKPTMALMMLANEIEDGDPVKSYGRLLTAAVMAGAFLNLKPETVASHAETFSRISAKVIEEHPEIYGAMTKQ